MGMALLLTERSLVTGASGFIGRALVRRLVAGGCHVRALVRNPLHVADFQPRVETIVGDVRNIEVVEMAVSGVDTVFHLAAKVHDVEELHDTGAHAGVTVQGTRNVLSAAIEARAKRLVFMSSLSVYGSPCELVRDETTACVPSSAYGRAKLYAEEIVLNGAAESGMHVCCLRPATTYGAGCKGNVLRMIRMIDRGLCPPLPPMGNRRSMAYVGDVVDAAILAACAPVANGRRYIVTDDRAYCSREIYEAICRALAKRIPPWHIHVSALRALARLGDGIGRVRGKRVAFDSDTLTKIIGSDSYSCARIVGELGYRPSMTFENALPEIVAWYRQSQA
jgi:nucleoside-diphosphate-sugar epimerase